MPVFERDGLSFNYLDKGSGIPFVFQHGLGGDLHQTSDAFSPPNGMRLISMECRGHGDTQPLGEEFKLSFSYFADDLVALLHYLGIEQAVVGGISMGAGVALNLALRHPERVAGMILSRPAWLDSPMPGNLKAYPVISRLLEEHGPERGRELFAKTEEHAELEQAAPGTGDSLAASQFGRARAVENAPVLGRLPNDAPNRNRCEWHQIRVPTLMLACRRDPAHPFSYAKILAHEMPSAELDELTPKADSEDRHAKDVQQAIMDFLARQDFQESSSSATHKVPKTADAQLAESSKRPCLVAILSEKAGSVPPLTHDRSVTFVTPNSPKT